mmetsp:Transcript_106134/g.204283  ORF Transcript_106134/g.204283 Transcript_106134/m.204283 type:complete len:664 (+) Transcript_106134:86-2077(+)
MRVVSLALSCLIFAGHGRRTQMPDWKLHRQSSTKSYTVPETSGSKLESKELRRSFPWTSLASLLLSLDPEAGWQSHSLSAGAGVRPHQAFTGRRPRDVSMQTVVGSHTEHGKSHIAHSTAHDAHVSVLSKHDEELAMKTGEAIAALLQDKRLIDELVVLFDYSGEFANPGSSQGHVTGQGNVKRALLSWLGLDDRPDGAAVAKWSLSTGRLTLELASATDGSLVPDFIPCEIELQVNQNTGLIKSMLIHNTGREHIVDLRPKHDTEADSDGPKWETFDGRVRQKIWQRADLFAAGNTFLKDTMELRTGRLVLIVDKRVWDLYGEKMNAWGQSVGLELDPIIAPGDEDQKTMENCLYMLDELKRADPLRRSEPVLAIGGGVLTDVAGFACALWRRGVPWCRMPTTLLGMVDASVGIKVAVNYHRKNGVGHFFSPVHTFVDHSFLPTVSLPDIRSGVGEIMKAALVHDRRLFELMEEHGEALIDAHFVENTTDSFPAGTADRVIKLSVDTMLDCIGPDLWEEALLRPMDFGHSFSRTLETDERFKLRHGEAVAIDCVMNTMIAEVKGLISHADADRVLALYAKLKLPCSVKGITADTYKRAVRDITIHRDGILRAPLPKGIGGCAFTDEMTDAEIDQAFARLEDFMAQNPELYWDLSQSFAAARS